ncbi:DUF1801 domain-containing protein [Psychroserpens sp. XS_ASV72]|uniref:DUF1801 domain-containing protein n=1 Tax=Psychroserpens sp. XS_ASV72 TaxID=3241293 RepID=UPI0035189A16
MNDKVEHYFAKLKAWKPELTKLRDLILDCGLEEEYKWRNPCYTDNGKNIIILGYTKEFCTVSFLKGELLKDQKNRLHKAGPNSRSAKYLSFTSEKEIDKNQDIIKSYINEAIDIERKGLKIDYKKDQELKLPKELIEKFNENPKLEKAFTSLTKGRQRGYLLHFSAAKQSKTIISRIEKYEERIYNGKGMLDCVCGLSKRMPNCDGSHKQLKK